MKRESERWTKKRLAVELSKLKNFEKVDVQLEQYATPSEIAADWLWNAVLNGDIDGKVIVDAACGPGILGCAALLMGAKKVVFVDKSEDALRLAHENVKTLEQAYFIGKSESWCGDIADFNGKADIVVQNPPFGTKIKHTDKVFLEKAFRTAPIVYSMHQIETVGFVEAIARDHTFQITNVFEYDFGLKQTLPWHKSRMYYVKVGLWRMEKLKTAGK
jgi:putative methylase